MSASHITRYDKMPIPPVEEHTEHFEAGVVSFGVGGLPLTATEQKQKSSG